MLYKEILAMNKPIENAIEGLSGNQPSPLTEVMHDEVDYPLVFGLSVA
jgi:hypothetical protein